MNKVVVGFKENPTTKSKAEGCVLYASSSRFLKNGMASVFCAVLVLGVLLPPFSAAARSAWAAEANMLVVAIDPGHGGSDPGAQGNGVDEADANWAIASACANELSSYSGVKVVLTKTENETVGSIYDRVQRAITQGADVVVSIHCNSVSGAPSAKGSEVWVPNSSSYRYGETYVPGYALGEAILSNLASLGFNNRGIKTRNSTNTTYPNGSIADYYGINYYSRLNGIPGIIVEHGFVTNSSDAEKLGSASWCKSIGEADAAAIARYYGLSKVPQNGSAVDDADVNKTGEAVVTQLDYDIMGSTALSQSADAATRKSEAVSKMVAWWNSKGKTYPSSVYASFGAAAIENFCEILYEEAVDEGVRPEIVFVQAMLETGWLQFGGQVNAEQCNFCGLGALDGQTSGSADYGAAYGEQGVRMGLRGQVQHLRAYADENASEGSLNHACVDPRFDLVSPKGKATTVCGLSGTWASSKSYGNNLSRLMSDLLDDGKASVSVSLDGVSGLAANGKVAVYVDGKAATMSVDAQGRGALPLSLFSDFAPKSIVMYEYNTSDTSDASKMYPTAMHTWLVKVENGKYTVQRYYGLDNLLIYSGCSIRVSGSKGIRMITGMSGNVKAALTGSGVSGYKLLEAGTLLSWASNTSNPTLESSGVSRGRAYVAGSSDPVFSSSNGIEYYTNVLTGNFSSSQCKSVLAMRPYVILEDADGRQFAIYGGTVQRSISYIAQQNADTFAAGTSAYNYIQQLINGS